MLLLMASGMLHDATPAVTECAMVPAMVDLARLADRIAYAVEKSGMKHADIAAAVGVARPQISMWASGKRVPELANLLALAEVLSVSPAWLIEGQSADQAADDSERELLRLWRALQSDKRRTAADVLRALLTAA